MNREEAGEALELLRRVVSQARDETTLENWGLIWIVHGMTNGLGFLATDWLLGAGRRTPLPYAILWAAVLAVNIGSILALKSEKSGARSFIEGQIWLIWSTFIVASTLACIVNYWMGLEVIFAGPMMALLAAVAFSAMGGVMGRRWFAYALAFAAAAPVMAAAPQRQFAILGAMWLLGQTGGGVQLTIERRRRLARGGGARLV